MWRLEYSVLDIKFLTHTQHLGTLLQFIVFFFSDQTAHYNYDCNAFAHGLCKAQLPATTPRVNSEIFPPKVNGPNKIDLATLEELCVLSSTIQFFDKFRYSVITHYWDRVVVRNPLDCSLRPARVFGTLKRLRRFIDFQSVHRSVARRPAFRRDTSAATFLREGYVCLAAPE